MSTILFTAYKSVRTIIVAGVLVTLFWIACLGLAKTGSFQLKSSQPRPELTQLFVKADGWTGADGAYSIPLGHNRTLWLFGDTFIGKVRNGRRIDSTMINNSGAFQSTNNQEKPLTFFWNNSAAKPEALFKPDDEKKWFWPGDGITSKGKVYVFLHVIQRNNSDSSAWGFKGVGDELAQIENPLEEPSTWRVHRESLPGTIQWGNATLLNNNYLYMYGEYPEAGRDFFKHPTVLARIAVDKLNQMNMHAWEYWCHASPGSTTGQWRSQAGDPFVLMIDGAPEMTVSRVPGLPGFYATYIRAGLGQDISIRHANNPEGPWGEPQIVYHCPNPGKGRFIYGAKAHEELATRDGELVITYNRNSESLKDNVEHALLYLPQAITVMLSP